MKNIIITGGAGYIGSLLTQKLLQLGFKVVVLDIFKWGITPLMHLITNPNLSVINIDIRDHNSHIFLSKADCIINLAGIVGYPACNQDKWQAYEINVKAVKEWTEKISKDQIFIQASTGSSYGIVDKICNEETPINPTTIYGSNKAEAEKYVLDKSGISLRFATLYGVSPRLRFDLLINQIVLSAIKDGYYVVYEGNFSRTFLSVYDAVLSIIFSLEKHSQMIGQCFNIGSEDQNYSKIEVINLIKKYINFNIIQNEFSKDKDQRNYTVCYKKITNLGFARQFSLQEGIQDLIKVVSIFKENSIYRNF
jgi:nucleoside-diphosphate-sugar epimerase